MDLSNPIPIIFIGGIALLLAFFAYYVIKNLSQPVLTRPAILVSKRTNVSGGAGDTSTSTSYYCTFELEGGERREFYVSGREFGLLAEGDRGTLTSQGDWYKGFERGFAKNAG